MATWKRRSWLTCRSWGSRAWTWGCTKKATKPETKRHVGQGLCSLSSLTQLWSSGCPRSNLRLRQQFLVQSLWLWNPEWKHYVGSNKSWEWWGFLSNDPHTYMETKCWLYTTPINRRLLWGKIVTQSATMLWYRVSQWVSCWRLTSQQVKIVQTCLQKYFTGWNGGITWATCYMKYMIITFRNITEIYHTFKDYCECYIPQYLLSLRASALVHPHRCCLP